MNIISAALNAGKLNIKLNISKKHVDKAMISLARRKDGGYEEKEFLFPITEVKEAKKEYAAEITIDIRDVVLDGYYWNVMFKASEKKDKEFVIVDSETAKVVQENAKSSETWINKKESIRLYPTKDGKLFLKKVVAGVVMQQFKAEDIIPLESYLKRENAKPQNMRYLCDLKTEGSKVSYALTDDADLGNEEFKLVLVSETDGKKQILDVTKKDKYIVDLESVNVTDKDTYRVYMAARREGFYYYFRLQAERLPMEYPKLSGMYRDSNLYIAKDKSSSCSYVFCVANGNDALSLICGDEAYVTEVSKGDFRVASEKNSDRYPFKFTMVIAVYNAENYLPETLDSLISQDIGFAKNIQVVLVDDGSKDNSLEVCNRYKAMFPDNFKVIHKENGGVSSTRNKGLENADGKFINFMDSDDLLSPNTCSLVWEFYEKQYDNIDVVSIPINQFGAIEGPHWQNYKFERGTRVIDLKSEFGITCMNSAASFIKNKVAKMFRFDETLDHAEDLKYMLQIVPLKMKIGVVAECEYKYRRYPEGVTSLVSSGKMKKNFYINSLEKLMDETIDKFMSTLGYIPLFVQNTLMVDLQWKLKMNEIPEGILTDEEIEAYKSKIVSILQKIDDRVILTQRMLPVEYKYQAIKLKYGRVNKTPIYKDISYTVDNQVITNLASIRNNVQFIEIVDDKIVFEGFTSVVDSVDDDIENYFSVGGKLYKTEVTDQKVEAYNVFGKLMECVPYRIELPLNKDVIGKNIYVYTSVNGHLVVRRNNIFGKFVPFSQLLEEQYAICGDYIILKKKNGFCVEKYSVSRHEELEKAYSEALFDLSERIRIKGDVEVHSQITKGMEFRKRYFEFMKTKKNQIWLISDRTDTAGDNGEAFFRFMCAKKPKDIDYYFVISESSKDYEAMKKLGNVIPFGSEELEFYTLVSDRIISAHAEEYIVNPFGKSISYVKDLRHFKYVFLQHGITKDDLSEWLNRYNKNIDMLVTAAKAEYDSFINGNYYYTEKQIKLTGLPRYDRLIGKKKSHKEIVFMPTWRTELASAVNPKTGKRVYMDKFKDSYFYEFYQKLISDERLLAVMKKKGYKGKFIVHPSNKENACDFIGNDRISICSENICYRDEFVNNDFMITDYSSVAFDFAYLRKPVVYTQSDREEFFAGHSYDEGYWNYDTDGFGPVCYNYEDTLSAIISAIENDCKLDKKYEERIDAFYDSFDDKNCQRVYDEIIKL